MVLSRYLNPLKQIVKKFSSDNIITPKGKPLQIPKVTLHELLWKNLDKWSDKTATICFETQRSYTYHQLYKRSLALTRFLKDSLKLQRHDTVGVVLPNVPEYPIVVVGAVQAGLRVTTCNPAYTPDELKTQLEDSESRVIVTVRQLVPLVRQATKLPIIEISNDKSFTTGTISFEEISSGEGCQPVSDVNLDDTIFLPYSSGTTGLPKGVELSHSSVVANLSQMIAPDFTVIHECDDTHQDVLPGILPFFHIYGLVAVMQYAMVSGAKLITMPRFSVDNFIKLLKDYKSDVVFGVPLMTLLAINHPNIKLEDLTKIRSLISGAAPLAASDVERFYSKTHNKVNLLQGYGSTESSSVLCVQTCQLEHGAKFGGIGFMVPQTFAKIIPVDGSSTQGLGPNQSGELIVKGPQMLSRYHKDPQATSEAFLEGKWFKTGDIAYYDDDGHFFITDRLKELIKVKGFQVAPAELEAVLRQHPSVADVGVIGVPHPVLGEAPRAFVVVKPGGEVKEAQLEEFVASKVVKYKQLVGGVRFIGAIPKNPAGKILRRELKKL